MSGRFAVCEILGRRSGGYQVNVEPLLVSIPDAAKMLGVSIDTVKRVINFKELPSVKFRDVRRIKIGDINRLINKSTTPVEPVLKDQKLEEAKDRKVRRVRKK